jgi:tRNA nucleotidyltransferase/poly(A) polymerase
LEQGNMNLPDELACLLREVPALSRAYLVGGCVRDSLLGIAHKDFDLEVYGVGTKFWRGP